MKLKDFDFRIWDKDEKCFLDPYTKSRAVVKNLPNEKLLNLEIELFTGLCDKNGNKIYEGDILYSFEDCSEDEAFKYKVVFKEEAFYLVECGDNGEEYDEDLISEFRLTELEIMGNIHENAELLKVKDDEAEENDIFFKGNMIVWLFGNYYSVYEVVKAYEESYIISDLMGRQIEIDHRVAMNGGYKDAKDDLFLWYFEVMENEEIKIYPKKLTYNQMLEECKKNDIYIIKPLYSLGYTYNNNREDFKNYN
ncbi:TPA: YopX family protein [Campylobacter coli]|uniref:YopX family protein n=1 Tax=Campylobacter coli TaxID=195 RepID=UPI000B50499F|nr:YopX family protein [Campylobacter coli]AVS38051.1 hypothetical protein C9J81_00745 [Campylobacter coli]EAK3686507.1 hypothetical protein [Campylobacter coli]ECO1947076.1 hypothetical protein [Campylobacter coli]ECO2091911.1 hypothetical protein [Campylobacter coli]MCE7204785.1 YopX family protein [Campylobacter coli]